jgi:hypothetical protein
LRLCDIQPVRRKERCKGISPHMATVDLVN